MTYKIVFAVDENYVQHLCVAIISLLKNNSTKGFTIFIINGGIKPKIFKRIEFLTAQFQCKVINITVNDKIFSELVTNHHFTKANYYRLLIPNFIQEDKVLYLDADIVVNSSIDTLYNADIGECLIGAVENPGFNRHAELGMNVNSKYFNSGVMVINLKKWKNENITNRVINFVANNSTSIKFVDQCGLNAIIDGNWKSLPLKCNQQAVVFEENFQENYHCFKLEDISTAKKDPIVVHYSGSSKPWHVTNRHPYKYLYWRYLRMTPYKFSLPAGLTVINLFRRILPEAFKNKLKLLLKIK